ncbi:hypothetical protein, variant [Aphanomyces astaci]|uniref:SUN domain-containing protein n=1 Tax=Aphanomyces astaci TaxID=112090 RepID=W4H9L5_APHAT|nr:hypothetical protein, variant [Aphanomyces astaci]ETV87813.1 hypothetical protein, variant [Aphanomyces astaci]|eukprot:XP_009822676.1 hypothetical protein, variant [Aphanomyces astaci]
MTSRQSYELRSRSGTPFDTPPPKSGRWMAQTPQETEDDGDRDGATSTHIHPTEGTSETPTSSTFTGDSAAFRDDSEFTTEYSDDSDDNQVQFIKHNKPRFGKRVHAVAVSAFRMLLEVVNLTWFLLPFICLVVALVLPRYLIAAIQATPASLAAPGQGHVNSMSSIQAHMDAMIKDIGHFKKFQHEHEARIEEVMILYDQTTKQLDTLVDTTRSATSGGNNGAVLEHVTDMIQTALKKSIRDLKSEYKAALQPLEASLRQISTQATLLESDVKTHKARLTDVEDLVEGTKAQLLDATSPQLLERQIASIVATELVVVQAKVSRAVAEETARLRNATQGDLERLVDRKVAAWTVHTSRPDDSTTPGTAAPSGRVDYASFASGGRVVRHKTDLVGGSSWASAVQNLFFATSSSSTFTSKSLTPFPLCSIVAGQSCQNSKPETAISVRAPPSSRVHPMDIGGLFLWICM